MREKISLPGEGLFAALSPEARGELSREARRGSYRAGEPLHIHRSTCLGVLLLTSGRARLTLLSGDGREAVLARLLPHEAFVLASACPLRGARSGARVEAETPCEAILLPREAVDRAGERNPAFRLALYETASARASTILDRVSGLLFDRVESRLARFLLEERRLCGSDTVRATHEVAAMYTASAREVVTRALDRFAREGYVTLARGQITLTARGIPALREMV